MLISHIVSSVKEYRKRTKRTVLWICSSSSSQQIKKCPKCENMICDYYYRKCDAKSRSIQWMHEK